jgi:hypothetical protein
MALPRLAFAVAATALLAGCVGSFGANSVTVAGQGYKTGTETRTLQCDATGNLAFGIQGGGSLTVKVTDGAGASRFSGSVVAGQDGQHQSLTGEPGTWTLTVATGFGFGGQYAIVLTC